MLETRELTIRFGGHVAVDHVSCAFAPGTLTAIVGPNGAGKTTYFNLISGQLRASAGSVRLNGADITAESVSARTHRGLGRAFQLTQLFPNLSVLENVRLAVQSRRRKVVTGQEQLMGSHGEVMGDCVGEGWAQVHGETWKVKSSVPLHQGDKVRVTRIDGLTLEVEPLSMAAKEAAS